MFAIKNVCVVRYQHIQHIQNLLTTAVDCGSIWTSALKRVLYLSTSCRNTGCRTFTPLFYGTVNQLLINLVPFTVMIFTKNVIITSLHKEFLTDSVEIKSPSVDIFTCGYSPKVSQNFANNCEKYTEKQMFHFFSEHGVYGIVSCEWIVPDEVECALLTKFTKQQSSQLRVAQFTAHAARLAALARSQQRRNGNLLLRPSINTHA